MRIRFVLRKIAHKVFVIADNDYNLDMKTDGEYHFLSRVIKTAPPNAVVFDIGAEKGDWSSHVRNLRKDLYIHLFDPFPDKSDIRIERFKNDMRVRMNEVAVSDTTGEVEFFPKTYSLHSRESVFKPGDKSLTVKSIRLDEYMKKNNIEEVYFAKLDIEGHELFALRGASESLKQGKIKYIQFEYGACNIDSRTYLKDFYDLIKDLNYEVAKLLPSSIEVVEQYDRLRENFYDSNWLIRRKQ